MADGMGGWDQQKVKGGRNVTKVYNRFNQNGDFCLEAQCLKNFGFRGYNFDYTEFMRWWGYDDRIRVWGKQITT